MFTGIVTAKGIVRAVSGETDRRFSIESSYNSDTIDIGASISHAGACLTVVEKAASEMGSLHVVEVSPETLDRTTLGNWVIGSVVNLERSLKMGDELGGHLVTGHIDGMGELVDRSGDGDWSKLDIRASKSITKFVAEKGSIAVDGVSLTVNGIANDVFSLMIIPHTAAVTTLGQLQLGAQVNLEVDLMARYAARLMQAED